MAQDERITVIAQNSESTHQYITGFQVSWFNVTYLMKFSNIIYFREKSVDDLTYFVLRCLY